MNVNVQNASSKNVANSNKGPIEKPQGQIHFHPGKAQRMQGGNDDKSDASSYSKYGNSGKY